jgi:hypothetical protein
VSWPRVIASWSWRRWVVGFLVEGRAFGPGFAVYLGPLAFVVQLKEVAYTTACQPSVRTKEPI